MTSDEEAAPQESEILARYRQREDEQWLRSHRALAEYRQIWGYILAAGILFLVLSYLALKPRTVAPWTPLLPLAVAAWLARQSRRALTKRWQASRLRDYYQAGIARLTRQWDDLDGGNAYLDDEHFYARDLDLFGHGSLFQLLCSARTQAGRDTLARWMKTPAGREEALARRAAIQELRTLEDLRERVALAGDTIVSDYRAETFEAWLAADFPPFPAWGQAAALALVCATALAAILWSVHTLNLDQAQRILSATIAAQIAFAWIFSTRVKTAIESVRLPSIELPILSEMFGIVERTHFSSDKLSALAGRLRHGEVSAARETRRLQRHVRLLDQRRNDWFTLLSYLLLWGTQWAMTLDRWRRRNGPALRDWLTALGEFEALLSLATYSYEHPHDPFPELLEHGPVFAAEGLAHPFLDEATCVRNDIELGDPARFLIISGSNMSGKSTFLRAMGLNTVLAWMGAPVRCRSLRLSRLTVGAAIRVQDSVVDGRSHFLAEMQRLRKMIDAAGQQPILFLADEVLSGTNSHDRRLTAEWVVRALVARGALGAITTHDLALTTIASNGLPGRNVHFTDTGGPDTLDFDYKMRPGLLERSNALNIARLLGIDQFALEDDPSSRAMPS